MTTPADKSATLGMAFRQIGGLTAISRIVGFARDIVFASFLGAGPATDAFLVALKLPNMFRRLSAEGAMTNAFLPNFARLRAAQGRGAALGLAAEAQIMLILVLFALVGLAELFMPQLVMLMAPGFAATPDRMAAAVDLGRITMPYLPMISIVALWGAIANAHDRFKAAAAAPIIANLCFIAGALAIPVMMADAGAMRGLPVAFGLLAAGLLQLLFLFVVLHRLDALPRLVWPRLSAAGRKMWHHFLPAALGAGGMQLNLLVDLILASLLPVGAISWLYYADRVAQLPLGIVGIALGTALLPRLSAAEATGQTADVSAAISRAIIYGGFLVIPAVTALLLIAMPIMTGLFTYGAFVIRDADMAALALMAYAVGLPGFVLVKILQPAFYAAGQPGTVLKISVLTVVVNITGSLLLMPVLGHIGLALATSLSGVVAALFMAGLLWRQRRLRGGWFGPLGRILLASMVMAAMLTALQHLVDPAHFGVPAALWLACLVLLGGASYAAAALVTGAVPAEWLARLSNRKA